MAIRREHWGSRIGFILAASGSAVGLGNIWKFPYMAGENGGGAFLVVYLVLVFTIGLSIMIAELVIGRAAQRNPVGAFARLKGRAWPLVGYIGVAAAFVILSYYSVVAGWTIAYIFKTGFGLLNTSDPEVVGGLFKDFVSSPTEPLFYHAVFVAITVGVVLGGVGHGIERWCKVLMPALFVILLILIVRSVTLEGSGKGLLFYLQPDFSKVSASTFNAALSQAFFSLSLGMGVMITYGSYLPHRDHLPGSAGYIVSLDSLVAFLAGLVIFPAVFAFGFDPSAGPGLVFITLPAVFSQIPAGALFGTLFFVFLTIAALTSSVSILEVTVAYFVDERGMKRERAAVMVGVLGFLLGIPSSLSLGVWSDFTIAGKGFLDAMDYLASNLLLPVGGLFIALFVGWVIFPQAMEELHGRSERVFAWAPLWRVICRYVAPVAIAWILISGL